MNSAASNLLHLLICPHCQSSLIDPNKNSHHKPGKATKEWQCPSCQLNFPNRHEIPWILSYPHSHWQQWDSKCQAYIHSLSNQVLHLRQQLLKINLLNTTSQRLELLIKGYEFNQNKLNQLLFSFLEKTEQQIHNINNSDVNSQKNKWPPFDQVNLHSRLPRNLGIPTYLDLLFRDWSWENNEISETLQILTSLMPSQEEIGNSLVILGGGSCRLGFELARYYPHCNFLAVDINPLGLIFAQEMKKQSQWELFEFPISPRSLEDSAVKRILKNPLGVIQNIHFLFADALNLPFKKESLPSLFTPWLIDVIPADLTYFMKKINSYLTMGGEWVNLGPLGFQHRDISYHFTSQEIKELLSQSGFEIRQWQETNLPYLQSPHSGHWRTEKIWAFRVRKIKKIKEPARYSYLPPWLTDHDQPIPREKFIDAVSTQSRFQFEVLTAVNGKHSLNTIALLMSDHYGMNLPRAREALISFLIRIFEDTL